MTTDNEKVFRTKPGFCHILPDKIILTRDGVIGNMSKIAVGNTIYRILFIYLILATWFFYLAFKDYKNGFTFETVFFGLLGLFLVFGILRSINNSATPVIDRNKIREVKFKKAIPGLTRSCFEVMFENENGKLKRRLIMLPGSLTDGQDETEKALEIMKDEKLIP